eukprot:2123985-Amphidinium_carterae.1
MFRGQAIVVLSSFTNAGFQNVWWSSWMSFSGSTSQLQNQKVKSQAKPQCSRRASRALSYGELSFVFVCLGAAAYCFTLTDTASH